MEMKDLNRVSGAQSGGLFQTNLCQEIRLFPPDNGPSRVGPSAQNQLQPKTSWTSASNYMDSDCHPSRLQGSHDMNLLKGNLPHIPQIRWKCPPKFGFNENWRVVAADESKEAEAQKQREMRVPEVVYHHRLAIPPCPSTSLDMEESNNGDSITPIIPEEDVDATNMHQGMFTSKNPNSPDSVASPLKPSANENPTPEMVSCPQPDVVVAAAATAVAIANIKEQGSMIDADMLIEIFRNPEMVRSLLNDAKARSNVQSGSSLLKAVVPSVPISMEPVSPDAGSVASSSAMTFRRTLNGYGRSEHVTLPLTALFSASSSAVTFRRTLNGYGRSEHVTLPLTALFSVPSPKVVTSPLPPSPPPFPNVVTQSLPMEPVSPDFVSASSFMPPLEPVSPDFPSHSSSSATTIKRMINEYGGPDLTGTEPRMGYKVPSPAVPLSGPTPDVSKLRLAPVVAQPFPPIRQLSVGNDPRFSAMTAPLVKDAEYNQNLMKHHGENHQTQFGNPHTHVQGYTRAQYQKPCMYFNSSKGCRNGSRCLYQHRTLDRTRPGSVLEAPTSKLMKLGGGSTGRIQKE